MKLFRFMASTVAVAALVTLYSPQQSFAQDPPPDQPAQGPPGQMKKTTNVHFMKLGLGTEMRDGKLKVACLGDPDTLIVSRGDVVIFESAGAKVNHVRWSGKMTNGDPLNADMENLSDDKRAETPSFERGSRWAIRISDKIPRGRPAYTLDVMCGDLPDGPPVIIVDP